jgi:hypothetical protein
MTHRIAIKTLATTTTCFLPFLVSFDTTQHTLAVSLTLGLTALFSFSSIGTVFRFTRNRRIIRRGSGSSKNPDDNTNDTTNDNVDTVAAFLTASCTKLENCRKKLDNQFFGLNFLICIEATLNPSIIQYNTVCLPPNDCRLSMYCGEY